MQPISDVQVPQLLRLGLPRHSSLVRRSTDFWNTLEVRADRILSELRNPSYVANQLERLNSSFTRALLEWITFDTDIPTWSNLAEIVCDQPDQIWVETIFLLMQFCEGKKYESFRTASQVLLVEDQFTPVDGHYEHMQTDRFLLALRVFCDEPEKLRFLLLWDNVDTRAYQRYSLVPVIPSQNDKELEGDGPTLSEIEQAIEAGIGIEYLTTDFVDSVLEEFEANRTSNRRSKCQGVLATDNGESCWVFIKRQLRENHLTEVDRTVFADEAELIIVRFRSEMREIDIKFELKDTIDLVSKFPSRLLRVPVEYVPVNETASESDVREFLQYLLADRDTTLKLMEVDNAGLQLAGSPRLILRGDKTTGIFEAVTHLRERHGLDLFETLGNLKSIKLSYSSLISTRAKTPPSYIVVVYLQQLSTEGRYFISFSTRAPMRDRAAFENYMWTEYDIRIVPRTER